MSNSERRARIERVWAALEERAAEFEAAGRQSDARMIREGVSKGRRS